jgi:hypothetical protein
MTGLRHALKEFAQRWRKFSFEADARKSLKDEFDT